MVRRPGRLAGAVLGAVIALSAPAYAAPPLRLSVDLAETFVAPFTSAYCGFDVVITIEGKLMVRLFFDKNGNPVRELDFQPSTKVTFSAPHSGRSFTFAEALVSRFEYSKGADIGSEVIITITGTGQRIGNFVDAGRLVIRGEIFDISPEGIPFVDFLEEVSQTGRVAGDTVDARCEALA